MADDSKRSPDAAFPLSTSDRIIVTVAGSVLLIFGAFAVYLSANQAGTVALLVVGGILLLYGINGLPLLGAKLMEFEFQMAANLNRAVSNLANRLPDDEAKLVLSIFTQASPKDYAEPLITLIDVLLFEARLRDAAMLTGEQLLPRVSPGIGEPLFDIALSDDMRIGVFATFSPTQHGQLTPEFTETFLSRLDAAGVQGALLVTLIPDSGDLARLADRIRIPVVIVHGGHAGQIPPIGPFLDQFRSPVPRQR